MKVCIIYDSKRGTTKKAAEAMKEALKEYAEVETKRVDEVSTLENCNIVIVGTPIYYEQPLKSVLNFFEKHSEELRDKKVAVFIVCFAIAFGSIVKWHIENHYLKPLVDRIPGEIIGTGVFRGGIRSLSEGELKKARRWALRVFLNL